jgi:hypothetical protein
MDTARNTSVKDVSLPKLLAMFFSPFAMFDRLETPQPQSDKLEVAGVRYRNSLFLFTCIDKHINRSAAVVAICFFSQGLFAVLQIGLFYLTTCVILLVATIHAAVLGIYRQVLNERVSKYAKIIDVERPKDRDEPEAFPRPPGAEVDHGTTVCGKPLVDRRRKPDRRK